MTALDPDLLAAAYLCGYRQATERLLPIVSDARRQALIDPLTQLRNRRAAQLHLNATAIGRADLWVAAVDAVGLKQINNTAGRSAGDRMLQAVATALASVAAELPGAMAFRLDGDEFLLSAHDVDPELPERIAAMLSAHLLAYGAAHPGEHQPAVSIGWAATRQIPPAGDVQIAAGVALARAKLIGGPRNGATVRAFRYGSGPSRAEAPDHRRIPGQRSPVVEQLVRSHSA